MNHAARSGFRHHVDEAAYAFQQALALYHLSPEANFRYAELFVRQNRFDEAMELMRAFKVKDPGNDKADAFITQVEGFKTLDARRVELEAYMKQNEGRADISKALELLEVYQKARNMNGFLSLGRSIMNNQHLDPRILLHLAQMFAQTKQFPELQMALERYVKADPNNFNASYDLAAIYAMRNQPDKAIDQFAQALRIDKQQALIRLQKDGRFVSLHKNARFVRLVSTAARPVAQPQPAPGQGPLAPGQQPPPAQGPLRNPQPAAPPTGGGFGFPKNAF